MMVFGRRDLKSAAEPAYQLGVCGGVAAIMVALAACAQMQAQEVARHREEAAAAMQARSEGLRHEVLAITNECREKRLSGQVRGFVGSVHCSNPRLQEAYAKSGVPPVVGNMDLISFLLAKKLELAEQVDAGKLTEGQMQVQLAETLHKATDMALARQQAAREAALRSQGAAAQAQAAQGAAEAVKTQQYLELMQMGLGMMSPQRPRPGITCTTFGDTTNCR